MCAMEKTELERTRLMQQWPKEVSPEGVQVSFAIALSLQEPLTAVLRSASRLPIRWRVSDMIR